MMKPKHIAVSLERDVRGWCERNRLEPAEAYDRRRGILNELIIAQIRLNIPVVTVFLMRFEGENRAREVAVESLANLFRELAGNEFILSNQIRVSVFGKWYDLPSSVVDNIKRVISESEGFDQFFLNLCVNYDGKEEIVDSCRIIARKIKAEKLDPDAITSDVIRENLYSSYFLPPDIAIVNGDKRLNGFMLWDLSESRIYFTNKEWPEFNSLDLKKAIDLFRLMD